MNHLHVRPFQLADAATVQSWFADEAAVVVWGGSPVRWPLDDAQIAVMRADPNRSLWTAIADGAICGHFQLFHDRRSRTVRLGRVGIAPALRGRGLAVPMLRIAAERAFADPAVHRIELHVYEHNTPARATYARLGYTLEGMLRENLPVVSGGETMLWSTMIMSLLRPEWEAQVRPAT